MGWRKEIGIGGYTISLALEERQQIGIDRLRLRSGHAVREILVGFQSSVLQQLCGERPGGDIGNDLVVFAMHNQHRNRDLFEVFREIGLRKGHDAVIVRFGTPPSCPGATNFG